MMTVLPAGSSGRATIRDNLLIGNPRNLKPGDSRLTVKPPPDQITQMRQTRSKITPPFASKTYVTHIVLE
jgi:hypothetical protein